MLASMLLGAVVVVAAPQTEAAEEHEEHVEFAELAEALDRAVDAGWKRLEIRTGCGTEQGYDDAEIYASGYGVWNTKTQFSLDEASVRRLLQAFRDAEFASMEPTYGGKADADQFQSPRLTCSVELELDGLRKHVGQLSGGPQSEPLKELATTILDTCREAAREGLQVENLADAVAKLSAGIVAPDLLHVIVHRKPGVGDSDASPESWVLEIQGRQATSRERASDAGYSTPVGIDLDAASFAALVAALSEANLAEMPGNLYSERYTDVTVGVLGYRKKLQARQFAGMTPESHGESQTRFDTLLEKLRALRARVLQEGEPRPWATSEP